MIDELTHFATGNRAGDKDKDRDRKRQRGGDRETEREGAGKEVEQGDVESLASTQASHMSKLTDVINHFMPLQTIFNEGYRRL